jgi:hypothetical protein
MTGDVKRLKIQTLVRELISQNNNIAEDVTKIINLMYKYMHNCEEIHVSTDRERIEIGFCYATPLKSNTYEVTYDMVTYRTDTFDIKYSKEFQKRVLHEIKKGKRKNQA